MVHAIMLVTRLLIFAPFSCLPAEYTAQPRAPRRATHVFEGPFLDDTGQDEAFSPQIRLSESKSVSTGDWSGHRVWPSAVVLLQHLQRTMGAKLQGLRVLELGCGLPVLGAVLAALGAEVCATDHPDALPHAQGVLSEDAPGATLTGLSLAARSRLRLRQLAWGESEDAPRNFSELCGFGGKVDLVIGADLVYDSFPAEALRETLVAALRTSGAVGVLTLQPRRFPATAHLSDPQKVSSFLRQLAGQPGNWEVRVDRPAQDEIFGQQQLDKMVIATVVPPTARKSEESADVKLRVLYTREEL